MAVYLGSTSFQCVPFVSMKNMDSSEEDFALLLLAEEEASIPKKIEAFGCDSTLKCGLCWMKKQKFDF